MEKISFDDAGKEVKISNDSTSQYYLPIHTDESTYSFIIALNDIDEYTGGGTYFVDLNKALIPSNYILNYNYNYNVYNIDAYIYTVYI